MSSECFAVIPARGGSKRIPRKNIRDFFGQPLISYSIQAAQKAGIFKEIFVSTDDFEIKEIAEQFGATVPFLRLGELATDTALTAPVIADLVSRLSLSRDAVVCCIYPTAPLIEAEKLRSGFELFVKSPGVDYVCAVTDYAYPIQRALFRDKSGLLNMHSVKYLNMRSQELEVAYHDAGQFYFALAETWLDGKPMLLNTLGIYLDRWKVQDLDTLEDWSRLSALYKLFYQN